MTADLDDAFGQLRNAYRLIWSYHRRLSDVLARVDGECRKAGLAHAGWAPLHYGFPPQSTSAWFGKNWSWDLLPGFAMVINWSREPVGGRSRHVQLVAEADDGFDPSRSPGEPDPAQWEETTNSVVRLLLIDVHGAGRGSQQLRRLIASRAVGAASGQLKRKIGDHMHEIESHVVDMADLPDDAAVHDRLLAPIRSWMQGAP